MVILKLFINNTDYDKYYTNAYNKLCNNRAYYRKTRINIHTYCGKQLAFSFIYHIKAYKTDYSEFCQRFYKLHHGFWLKKVKFFKQHFYHISRH